jgi:hypothetical protein
MKIFIAGVMQGNKREYAIHSQDYREQIAKRLQQIIPDVEIIDPDKTDPARLTYNDQDAATIFFKYCEMAGKVDLLISYIPEASMGTAIEMWVAYKAGIPIITISPLKLNWVVKLLSSHVYENINDFCDKLDIRTLNKILK